ncbi:MAG: DUF1328 domain-containing protein [Planctomycetaceae bacterium]|nr:DUF1328 domain-containing protein [Planctomycetaceae bacterium]
MLSWALLFLILALISSALEMTVIAGTSLWIAKVLFLAFIVFLVIALVTGRRTTPL